MVDVPRSLQDKLDRERAIQDMMENRPSPSIAAGLTRAFLGQGMGMGFGDEAEALAREKLGQGSYSDLRKDINKEYGRFAERYPFSSGIAEFAGGAAPAVASILMAPATGGASVPAAGAAATRSLGALSRLAASPYARSVGISGTQGAITGAGTSEEDSRLGGAVGGTILGAGIGAVAPAAIRGGGAALNWLRERALPSDKFVDDRALMKMSQALESGGMKPSDITARMQRDKALGVPSVLANTDESLADLADVVAQRSGAANRMVRGTLEEQKGGSRERVMEQARQGISGKNYFDDEAQAVQNLRKNANTQYDEAYAFGSVQDPRIMRVLQDPEFASFFEKAKKIANKEALAEELAGGNPDKFRLKELYKFQNDKDGNIIGFELVQIPDVRTLDYIKRGIDSSIESGFAGGSLSKTEAQSLKDLRKIFVKSIDEATVDPSTGVSAYATARKAYAGDMEVIDAMRDGYSKFRSTPHELVSDFMKNASVAEQEAYRSGAVRNIYDIIMKPSRDINAAKTLIESPDMKLKLKAVFETPQKFDLFKAALERESELYGQAQRILGGSPTARRTAMREQFEEGSNVGEMIANAVTGGWMSSLTNLAARAISSTTMTDDVAKNVAKRLMSKNPKDVAAAVQELEDFAAAQAPKAKQLSAFETGVAGGTTVSLPSAPFSEESASGNDIEQAVRNMRASPAEPLGLSIEDAIKARNSARQN